MDTFILVAHSLDNNKGNRICITAVEQVIHIHTPILQYTCIHPNPLIIIVLNFAILTNVLLEFIDIKLPNLRTLGFLEQLLGINLTFSWLKCSQINMQWYSSPKSLKHFVQILKFLSILLCLPISIGSLWLHIQNFVIGILNSFGKYIKYFSINNSLL